MKINYRSDSEDIRIYFNKILHLRIPRNKNIIIHSWKQEDTKLNYIKISYHSNNYITLEYDSEYIWKEILNILNTII